MSTRKIFPAVVALALIGTPALAASVTGTRAPGAPDHERFTASMECDAYQQQFDQAIKSHAFVPMVEKAKTLRSDGGTLCSTGKETQGIIKLEQALKDLGVTPSKG